MVLVTTNNSNKVMQSSEIKTISGLLNDDESRARWNSAWGANTSQVTMQGDQHKVYNRAVSLAVGLEQKPVILNHGARYTFPGQEQ